MKAPLPPNEAERLAALRHYEVLDTAPEEAFDDLTLLAAHICQVPMAMVSLIDENRQWFKSKIGTQATETPRDLAFCSHTILHADEVLEVSDATADPRFSGHPLVTGDPHIRFYAGAPLVTSEGYALGSLCVIDRVPRTLTTEQLAALRALSRRVVDQLELRQHARQLASGVEEARKNLAVAEDSRRVLLSLLEDQKLTETTLRESEELFRQITETIQEVFWMTDAEKDQTIYVSPSYEKIWGRTCASLCAKPREWIQSIYPEDRDRVAAAAAAKQRVGGYDETYRIVRPDGTVRWIRNQAFPVKPVSGPVRRIVGVAEDVTEQKNLHEQFLRAQRLDSIGMLAAGIAHDLNNVLAPVGMVSTLLSTRLTESRDLKMLQILEKSAERGAGLVRQILGFAHGVGGEPRLLQMKHLLRDILSVVTETFPKSIVVDEHVPNDLLPILANPTQIHQVLLNLCVNARDAMPQGGTLRLRGENCTLTTEAADALAADYPGAGVAPGDWVVLHIQDSGTGIPPAVLARIWEPFFTTKLPDKGTGLGLSTVLGIVKTHHGFITLKTEQGRGSTFRVYLPAIGAPDSGDAERSASPMPRGNDELILIVDDEATVRDTVAAILAHHNYRVVKAADGVEGAALFAARSSEFSLVITDRDMPMLDGGGLARILRASKPEIKIIAISGLGESSRGHLPDSKHDKLPNTFLRKPFTAETLLRSIAELLRGS
jgi:two-component system cell cycle sensor histidine kinase/response regulator CckA